ncbi:hypothetical protein AAC03nite_02500 [Alicyclobacillus acidoterrestris]|nr:hypothetical protein AAC03nite_02500 [Alicyclobacillus acidoterrestris]
MLGVGELIQSGTMTNVDMENHRGQALDTVDKDIVLWEANATIVLRFYWRLDISFQVFA